MHACTCEYLCFNGWRAVLRDELVVFTFQMLSLMCKCKQQRQSAEAVNYVFLYHVANFITERLTQAVHPRIDLCAEIRPRAAHNEPGNVPESTGGGGSHEHHWRAVLMGSQHSHSVAHHSFTISGMCLSFLSAFISVLCWTWLFTFVGTGASTSVKRIVGLPTRWLLQVTSTLL